MRSKNHEASQPGVLRVFQCRRETRAFYDKISKVYDLLAEHSEEPIRQAAMAKLSAEPGEKILEIGPGTGHCLAVFARNVGEAGRACGIDLSEGMLGQAQKHLQREELPRQPTLCCGDATCLPFADAVFDGVFMSFTLELFDTPEIGTVLGECMRVLKQGGRAVVAGMSRVQGESPMLRAFEWTHKHFPNFLDCRPIFVRKALEAAGFKIASSEITEMWVPVEIVVGVKP